MLRAGSAIVDTTSVLRPNPHHLNRFTSASYQHPYSHQQRSPTARPHRHCPQLPNPPRRGYTFNTRRIQDNSWQSPPIRHLATITSVVIDRATNTHHLAASTLVSATDHQSDASKIVSTPLATTSTPCYVTFAAPGAETTTLTPEADATKDTSLDGKYSFFFVCVAG